MPAAEKDTASKVTASAYKRALDLVCDFVDAKAKILGESQSDADRALLELASLVKMKSNGRAAQYLNHFIYGDCSDIRFSMASLLTEDVGVMKSVRDGILKKIRDNPSIVSDRKMVCGGDYLIPVRQGDFRNQDWRLAIGSFPVEWEIKMVSNDKKKIFVKVWGRNEYKWHPAHQRVTQCLHEAGDRLDKEKNRIGGGNFWMIADPIVIDVISGEVMLK